MGRGRAKAKQTKVARELKYRTPETDLDALQRELAARQPGPAGADGRERHVDDVEREFDPDEESKSA